ncbi:MAG: rod shape-determining protein [Candidatus Portnoybacteria bacterium RIFCSPLOWO2_12_FULL_39_9]|uniref:Cell shape-determining protein MreB n=1 Tax=Candidatus Portnoybacteria bacterium RIFCSPHIGHO2_12_FULL_38_9 TaxID=1801997 RepID=A0A1G2FEL8_9BACT|nr:MAG: rod shape-determining protein [Candidatus Portnoybacteria bacterium RIFCSPHIGHO2_02_FULL_39_12]OGZ36524.1 MAG: rod shape-determining protein [Candidatus Portnoybacteria bacterium RIFCSPHIGHO2_12_FULL_38_9]OGZ38532.1 MAG: rod shape-determining protein [Candidatus Portnoybacteria bacterium RIFCSPLOWO2_01_FULL_38_39]OGZ41288.1 MAG: rod shape-determining protein [Candidatus Portnoybacteria bacterium RIFCSPLOWO2_12_FULL_39_9]
MFIKKIGIDLGTANTLVYVPKKGVIINEPTVVAVSLEDNRILAVGNEAKKMLGRTPETIVASRPMKDGVIADYRVTEAMLRYFIDKALGRLHFFRPDVMVAVAAGITSTERRAVIEATVKAGAKAAYVVKEPVLAAIGAGLSINEPAGHMIVDMGGGTSEMAVISLGGIVAWASVRIGGDKIDQAISEYIRKKHNLAIGERTAEEIKIKIGSALPQESQESLEIRGRDLLSGLPKTVEVKSNEINEAISDQLREIVQAIKAVLHETPPELAADIIDKGMTLSGGGALLRHLNELITQLTGVNCVVAKDPLLCVARGAGLALEHLDVYKRSIMSKK